MELANWENVDAKIELRVKCFVFFQPTSSRGSTEFPQAHKRLVARDFLLNFKTILRFYSEFSDMKSRGFGWSRFVWDDSVDIKRNENIVKII